MIWSRAAPMWVRDRGQYASKFAMHNNFEHFTQFIG